MRIPPTMSRSRTAFAISVSVHAIVLLWGILTFTVKSLEANPVESLPIDIISDSEFTQITAGIKTAPKVTTPKPLVEKIGEKKAAEELSPVIDKKQEIQTASAEPMPPPPPPESKPPEPAKQEPAKTEPPPDPVAEAIKAEEQRRKDEQKKAEEKKKEEKKKAEEKKKQEEKRKAEEAKKHQFDPSKIAALLDKRAPQRQAATGDVLNQTASLGLPTGTAATLSISEIDALRAQIQACWNPPAGAVDARELIVRVRLMLRQDGSLSAEPYVTNRGGHPAFQIAAESALRAVRRCAPYRMPAAKYDIWKDVEVTFDPRDMFRG